MIATFKKIENDCSKPKFSMPLSLRLIKECSQANIDFKNMHIIDLMSIIYSIRIDNANNYLKQKNQQTMKERGVVEIRKATLEDFNKL